MMELLVPIAFALMIAAGAVFAFRAMRGKGGFGGGATSARGFAEGTLTVTGVSAGAADRNDDRYVTVTGTISSAQSPPAEIYGRMVVRSSGNEPVVGQEFPVVFKPGKADSTWRLGSLTDG